MTIHCFAASKDLLGSTLELDVTSVGELRQRLALPFPYLVAVNHEYAADEALISANDEVAIIPPVSGGVK